MPNRPGVDPKPPLPGGAEADARRETQRYRRRILEGRWRTDLDDKIRTFWAAEVAAQITLRDMSKNLAGRVSTEVAVLYERPPVVSNDDAPDALDELGDVLAEAGLWQLQQGTNRLAYGLREMFVRPDAVTLDDGSAGVAYRLVPPDMTQAYASPDRPDEPWLLFEARLRTVLGKSRWTWDVCDLREQSAPAYRVLLADGKGDDPDVVIASSTDVTAEVLGADGGWLWTRGDGSPLWPYVTYHAQRTGRLFDELRHIEMFDASIMVAAYYSFWGMCVRDGSYPIRTIHGSVKGIGVRGDDSETRRTATIAPGVVLELESPDGGLTSPSIDQWGPAVDPERLQMSIEAYEKRAMIDAGLSPSDVDKSGGPESGYAKTVSRESVRRVARAMGSPFRRADETLLTLTAALLNRWGGRSLPEDGWRVEHQGMPQTPAEIQAQTEQIRSDIALGLASLIDVVLARFPSLRSRDEAADFLREREAERRMFGAETT